MAPFTPTSYSPALEPLLREPRLAPLGPGTPNRAVWPILTALTPEQAFAPHLVRDHDMAVACLAGLWLYHDFLDESHALSQNLLTPTGSYWHGLLHRREPDYNNARYWFRRVGTHPIYESLRTAAVELTAGDLPSAATFLRSKSAWDPFAFINLCQKAESSRSPLEILCRQIQQREWELLFDWCYRQALGTTQ